LGKLRTLSGKDVSNILQKYGFREIRQKGSHIVLQKKLDDTTLTIPVPNHPELKTGTLQSIIRQSGLSKEIFLTK